MAQVRLELKVFSVFFFHTLSVLVLKQNFVCCDTWQYISTVQYWGKNDLAAGRWRFHRKCDVWLKWSFCLAGLEITRYPARTQHGHFVFCAVWHSELLLMITRCQKFVTFVLWLQTEPLISCVCLWSGHMQKSVSSQLNLRSCTFVCAFKFSETSCVCYSNWGRLLCLYKFVCHFYLFVLLQCC